MSVTRIAKRYATPLLELAEENNVLEEVHQDMLGLEKLCKTNRDFLAMLKSPVIAHLTKADILRKIFKGKVQSMTLSLYDIMARKNRENILPELAQEFVIMYNARKGLQPATVVTTHELDEPTRKEFRQLVNTISKKEPILTEKIDEEIIGGYLLKMDDQQIDQTISGKLKELKIKFKQE